MSELLASCRNVSVVYGDGESEVRALDGVDLEVAPGDSVALLGRSGSGKTTLLHVLGGLVEPTSGTAEWRGQPLSSLDAAARGAIRAHGIAYVFRGGNHPADCISLEIVRGTGAQPGRRLNTIS